MKWRNEYGEAGTDSMFWGLVGVLLVLALPGLAGAAVVERALSRGGESYRYAGGNGYVTEWEDE